MATSLLLQPALLRLVPLVTTTSSLYFSWDQYFFLRIFTEKPIHEPSNKLLAYYFPKVFDRGAPIVIGLLLGTLSSALTNVYYTPKLAIDSAVFASSGARSWYLASAAFAVGHMFWTPFVVAPINAIYADQKEKNVPTLATWLKFHVARTLTADLVAWGCCFVAVTKYFGTALEMAATGTN